MVGPGRLLASSPAPTPMISMIFPEIIDQNADHPPDFSPHLCVGFLILVAFAAVVAAAVCVAGLALGDIHLHFAWQVWHLGTSIFILRGRHGPYGTGLALCHTPSFVAHTALSHTVFHTHLGHTTLSHTSLSHTSLSHTTLSHTHTPSFAHTTLSHATLSCTVFRTHTHKHMFVTHHHTHTHTIFYTQPCHTSSWSHTTLHIQLFNWSIHHHLCLSFLPHTPLRCQSEMVRRKTCFLLVRINIPIYGKRWE